MKYLTSLYLLPICFLGCSSPTAQDHSFQAELRAAGKLLDGDETTPPDPDAALLLTDEILEKHGDVRQARVLAAQANIALASHPDRESIKESLFKDAMRHYERALELDPDDQKSCLQLSWVYLQLGEFRNGRDVAAKAAKIADAKGDRDGFGEALLAMGNCGYYILREELRANPWEEGENPSPKIVGIAQSVLTDFERAKAFKPGEAHLRASYVYNSMRRPSEEFKELEDGMHRDPGYFFLHTRYRSLRSSRGEQAQAVAYYRRNLRDNGPNASISFALGTAQHDLADKMRQDGNAEGARANYLAAIQSFETSIKGKKDFEANCRVWIAIEHLNLAKMSEDAGNLAAAKKHLIAAYRSTPKVLDTNEDGTPAIYDASSGAVYAGILDRVGRAIGSARTAEALRDELAYWKEFIALHPDKLGWLYNNAGLTARDLATMIEVRGRRGDPAARATAEKDAKALYEESYQLYVKAVELAPDNARILNDCGLMLIYYLHRDLDAAKAMFEKALELGKADLENLDVDTPEEDRHSAEETVGDAYQNLAKMQRDAGQPFEAYKPLLVEAVKYFPYQRREAALWLRTQGRGRGAGNRGGASNAQGTKKKPKVDKRQATYEKIHAEAQKLATANDYDGALLVLDKVASEMVGLAAFHRDRGLYSLRYAQQAMANGGSTGLIGGLLGDARRNLQKAVELDGEPVATRLALANANYESGEFATASKVAASLLSHIASRGGTDEDELAQSHRVRALAGNQVYVSEKSNGKDAPGELQGARNSFRALETMGRLDLDARKKWSVMERWAGNNAGALDVFTRALAKTPDDQALLGAYVEATRGMQKTGHAIQALGNREDALAQWYLGMLHYYSAYENPQDATAAQVAARGIPKIEQAIQSFEASAKKNPAYKASCRGWIATCQGVAGFFAYSAEDMATAQKYFLASATTAVDRIQAQIYGERTVKDGIELIVDHHYRKNDLGAAVKTLQAACAVIKNDAGLSNNLGLFARDHGVALERAGKVEEAKKLYEASHDGYRNSVRLEPDSVRQRNDLIVVLLYHVKRDLDYAKKTLEACIVDGEKQLLDPPDDPSELQDLQETVGDCYENLGYYHMTYSKDLAAARKNLEKSLTFYPFKRRRGVSFLRRLDTMKDGK